MPKKPGGLNRNRGLGNLIPVDTEENTIVSGETGVMVPIEKVEPNRSQPRKTFEEDALNELAESIKQHGIINPLLVRKKDDYYEIVGGERRWRASKIAGLTEVPVLIRDLSDREVAEIGLIDNLQREDLNPIEEAMAFKRLIDEFGLKQDEVADRVSKSRTAVTNSMRLLKLDPKVQQMLIDDMISSGHARAILALPETENQAAFAERVFDEKMSVRETERAIKQIQNKKEKKDKTSKNDSQMAAVYGEIEERLKTILGTKVRINSKDDNKGAIEIEYYTKEQMAELIEKLEA